MTAADLRALATERRRVGWEISDVMTPRQMECLADEMDRRDARIKELETGVRDAQRLAMQLSQ